MEYLELGQILKTFGLKGALKCYSLTSFPEIRFKKGNKISLHNQRSDERMEVTVASYRLDGDCFFITFEEINDINIAENYIHWYLEISKEEATVPEGYYRYSDLYGYIVLNADTGEKLGKLIEIAAYSKTPNMKVQKEDGTNFYVPFSFKTFITEISDESKTIKINVLPGLL